MGSRFSQVVVLVISAIIALVGLFMAAKAEDGLFGFHGWLFVIFGVLMCYHMGAKLTEDGDG